MTLELLLERTRSRSGLAVRLARASCLGLAAAIVAELGWIAERGLAHSRETGLGLAATLIVAALLALALGRRPSRAHAARRIDEALGGRSLVETATEALDGKHGAFAAMVVGEAEQALAGKDLRGLVPIALPPALGAGALAAILLLAVGLRPVAEAVPETRNPIDGIEVASEQGAGAETPAKPKSKRVKAVVSPGKSSSRLDDGAALELSRELRRLAQELALRPAPADPEGGNEEKQVSELEHALARGDAEAARAAMKALSSAGTARSAARVEKAADTLTGKRGAEENASSGSGTGTGTGTGTGSPGTGTGTGTGTDPGRTASETTSWRVREAIARYREAIE
jgi:hypothetical protein